MRFVIIVAAIFLFGACVQEKSGGTIAYDLVAKVIHIKDGDSFVVLDDKKRKVEVRLIHIDAPELYQAYGKKAKHYLSKLIKGKRVGIDYDKIDRYNRILATVYIEDKLVNIEMIRAGYAWHFTRFSNDAELQEAEDEAREAGRGLWQDKKPQAPWKWRKEHRRF